MRDELIVLTKNFLLKDTSPLVIIINDKPITTGEQIANAIDCLIESRLNLAASGDISEGSLFAKRVNEAKKTIADGINFQLKAKKAHDETLNI